MLQQFRLYSCFVDYCRNHWTRYGTVVLGSFEETDKTGENIGAHSHGQKGTLVPLKTIGMLWLMLYPNDGNHPNSDRKEQWSVQEHGHGSISVPSYQGEKGRKRGQKIRLLRSLDRVLAVRNLTIGVAKVARAHARSLARKHNQGKRHIERNKNFVVRYARSLGF